MDPKDLNLEKIKEEGNFWFVKEKPEEIIKRINAALKNGSRITNSTPDEVQEILNKIYKAALRAESQIYIDQYECCGGYREVCEGLVDMYECFEPGVNILAGRIGLLKDRLKTDSSLYEALFTDKFYKTREEKSITIKCRNGRVLNEDYTKSDKEGLKYMMPAYLFIVLGNVYGHRGKEHLEPFRCHEILMLALRLLHKVMLCAFRDPTNEPTFELNYMPIGNWFIQEFMEKENADKRIKQFIGLRKMGGKTIEIMRPWGIIYWYPHEEWFLPKENEKKKFDNATFRDREMTVQALAESGVPNFELIKYTDDERLDIIFAYTFCRKPLWLGDIKAYLAELQPEEKKIKICKKICVKLALDLNELHKRNIYHRALDDSAIVFDKKDDEIHPFIINLSYAKIFADNMHTVSEERERACVNKKFMATASYSSETIKIINDSQINEKSVRLDRWDTYSLGIIFRELLCGQPTDKAVKVSDLKEIYKDYTNIFDNDFWKLLEDMHLVSIPPQHQNRKLRATTAEVALRLTILDQLNELTKIPEDRRYSVTEKIKSKLVTIYPRIFYRLIDNLFKKR